MVNKTAPPSQTELQRMMEFVDETEA